VQGGGQPSLPDHVGGALGALLVEEPGGGQRRGPDRLLGDLQAGGGQASGQVTGGVDAVVGQQQEPVAGVLQALDELVGAGDEPFFMDQDAVHVHQVGLDRALVGHKITRFRYGERQRGAIAGWPRSAAAPPR
jgi:hypothetical protein